MNLSEYLADKQNQSSALARAIGVPAALVYQWKTGIRPISTDHCAAIEMATGGKVSRRDLRPDDWQRIWPELAERKEAA
jgi:DNA-binding transcriptional regulator YdaS (Cro superfamily)